MRKWMVALMVVLTIGLAGGVFWLMTTSDHEGPEIIFDKDKEDRYEEGMDNSELLKDVKAKDEKDGDVSDTLTVESVYEKDNGREVVVIFVAKDSSNNVTKTEFTMTTEDGSEEEEKTEDEKETKKSSDKSKDGYSEEPANAEISTEGEPQETPEPAKPQENLAKEEQAKKDQEEKIEKLNPQDPRMYLTTYYLEIPAGTSIDRLSYVADIKDDVDETNVLWRGIQIDGILDVNTPGTYELTYFVVDSNGNSSNGAVLTVVVE